MSRFNDDYSDCAMPHELWRANVDRALRGKRGQKALRELRDVLWALPEKRLIEGNLCEVTYDDEDRPTRVEFCAVGALVFHKRVAAGEATEAVLVDMTRYNDEDEWFTVEQGKDVGLTFTLAWELAQRNDETWGDLAPEVRYLKYLAWVESQIIGPV